MPQELKEKFSDDEFYYFLDLIDEYYSESGILDVEPDEEGCVEVDLGQIVDYIIKEAHKDEMGDLIRKKSCSWFKVNWNIRSHWMMMKNRKVQLSKKGVRTVCWTFFVELFHTCRADSTLFIILVKPFNALAMNNKGATIELWHASCVFYL